MNLSSILIKSLIKQVLHHPPTPYYSTPSTIQSSVGLILKFPSNPIQTLSNLQSILYQQKQISSVQLLFVQRSNYITDKNAYNIVFPGGQCDGKENDRQACDRELMEEIRINTLQQCLYIGQLPRNFYYMKKRGKQVHITCHLYLLKTDQLDWTPTLNPDQLRAYKWVSISQLLRKQNYKIHAQLKLGMLQRMPSFAANIARKNITNICMPQLDLGMDRNLWGLTLWIWFYVLQMAHHNLLSNKYIQEKLQFNQLFQFMKMFEIQFRPRSLFKIPVTILAKGWHYLYRVRPFTYQGSTKYSKTIINFKNIIAVVCVLVILQFFVQIF